MSIRVTAIHPLRAIEGGRITIDGAAFPVDRAAAARGARRRPAGARRLRLADAARRDRARRALEGGRARGAHRRRRRRRARVRRRRGAVRDRPPPGGQPGLRPRRQSLRHLQRHARPAGAGVDLPRAARTARARPSRPASSTRRRWRSIRRGPSLRVEPVRGHGLSCRRRTGRPSRSRTDLGVACGLAFAPDGTLFVGDRSGTIFRVDRDGHARRRSRRCRRASRRFTWRSGPTARCMSPARRCRPTIRSTASNPTARSRRPYAGFGRPQGLAFDPGGTLFVVEALAGASGLYRRRRPHGDAASSCSPAPALVGVAFDPRRRRSSCGRTTRPTGCASVIGIGQSSSRLDIVGHNAAIDVADPITIPTASMSQLFQRKPIAALVRRGDRGPALQARDGRRRSDHARDRRGDRRRHLFVDRHGRRGRDAAVRRGRALRRRARRWCCRSCCSGSSAASRRCATRSWRR